MLADHLFAVLLTLLLGLQMLMDLGPVVYVEDFEKHFLAKAAEFYQVRSNNISSVPLTCLCACVAVTEASLLHQ